MASLMSFMLILSFLLELRCVSTWIKSIKVSPSIFQQTYVILLLSNSWAYKNSTLLPFNKLALLEVFNLSFDFSSLVVIRWWACIWLCQIATFIHILDALDGEGYGLLVQFTLLDVFALHDHSGTIQGDGSHIRIAQCDGCLAVLHGLLNLPKSFQRDGPIGIVETILVI